MDLTQEQIDAIVTSTSNTVMNKLEPKIAQFCTKQIEDLDIPDTRNMATKKFVGDAIVEAIKPVTEEIAKTNTAVTKIATETETKITELTTKKSDWTDMFKTILDYEG